MFPVLFFTAIFAISSCEAVLESPRVTNWGEWGIWERCPTDTFVIGMRLKTERVTHSITGDNTALNGIQFFCAKPGEEINGKKFITSSYANWGQWGRQYECPQGGVVTGFQLRSDKSRGIMLGMLQADDTAANNLRIFCDHDNQYIEGDGNNWGYWTTSQHCLRHQAICGLKTQVEWSQGWRDDTALNNIEVQCCDLPSDHVLSRS